MAGFSLLGQRFQAEFSKLAFCHCSAGAIQVCKVLAIAGGGSSQPAELTCMSPVMLCCSIKKQRQRLYKL